MAEVVKRIMDWLGLLTLLSTEKAAGCVLLNILCCYELELSVGRYVSNSPVLLIYIVYLID